MKINMKREIGIIILVLMTPMLHEIAHALVYVICGIPVTVTYGFARAERDLSSALLAGPLYHILVSSICLILERYNKKNKEVWAIIGLVTIISRLVSTSLVIFLAACINQKLLLDNDEGYVANSLGVSIGFFYFICILLYFVLFLLHNKVIKDKRLVIRIFLYTALVIIYLTTKW